MSVFQAKKNHTIATTGKIFTMTQTCVVIFAHIKTGTTWDHGELMMGQSWEKHRLKIEYCNKIWMS